MTSIFKSRFFFRRAILFLTLVFSVAAWAQTGGRIPVDTKAGQREPHAQDGAFENPFGSSENADAIAGDTSAGGAGLHSGPERRNPFAAPNMGGPGRRAPKNPPFWYPLVVWQKNMNERLSATMKSLKDDFSIWKVLIIFFVSLAYAVGHTAGPGHGKVILGTFFLTSDIKRQRKDALTAGIIVSLTHIGMAFLLSLILYLIIHSLSMGSQRDMAEVSKRIGGAFVILTGIVLMSITLFRNKLSFLSLDKSRAKFDKYSLYTVAVLAGIVPCPLAWFVLVFSISFGIYAYGIISVAGMAIGAALTVATASYLSIIGRDKAMEMVSAKKVASIGLWLRFAGGCVLVCAGSLMILPTQ